MPYYAILLAKPPHQTILHKNHTPHVLYRTIYDAFNIQHKMVPVYGLTTTAMSARSPPPPPHILNPPQTVQKYISDSKLHRINKIRPFLVY